MIKRTKQFFKRNGTNMLFAVLFLIPLTVNKLYPESFDSKTLFGILASIATLYFGNLKLRMENDVLFKQLFESFNLRYDTKINDLLNELRNNESRLLQEHGEKNLIIDYFNLCAEEYLWKTKGRIPEDVWKAWKAGIIENLKIKQVRDLFDEETKTESGKISYYGLVDELK